MNEEGNAPDCIKSYDFEAFRMMKTDCSYAHTKYVNEGRFPQWLYFVVQDEVETLPPLKEFYGPLMATLRGDSYASDASGAFSKQTGEEMV